VLVADCPCHGKKYHDYHSHGDTYPDGDPNGRVMEDYITKLAKLEVDLYAIKITSDTDKMYTILSECYNNTRGKSIQISELGHSTNEFAFFVSNSATQSLSLSKTSISDESKLD
jgi:hypothetical protein